MFAKILHQGDEKDEGGAFEDVDDDLVGGVWRHSEDNSGNGFPFDLR
jgi:hypothetical protein